MNAAVTIVGGLGLFLLGIHHLTEGLKGLAGDSLRRALQTLVGGRLSAIVSGAFHCCDPILNRDDAYGHWFCQRRLG